MDWYPTILELAGVNPPKNVELDGHSVMPLVRDANAKTRYGVMHWQWQDRWMVRDGAWKLLVNSRATPDSPPLDEVHLGNLGDDQPERRNHAKEQPQTVQRLTSLHGRMGGQSYAGGPGRRDELAVILHPEQAFLASNPGARGCNQFVRDKLPISNEIRAGDFGHASFTREGQARRVISYSASFG